MQPEEVMTLAYQGMRVALFLAGPIMLTTLATGLLISLFQAATQVNEMTMTFVPKIVAVMITAVLFLPFIVSKLTTFTQEIFARITAVGLS